MLKKKEIIIDELEMMRQIAVSIAGNSYNTYNEIIQYIETNYYREKIVAKDVLKGLVEYLHEAKKQVKQYLATITKDGEILNEQKKCAKKSKSR